MSKSQFSLKPGMHYDVSIRKTAARTKHIGAKFQVECDLIEKDIIAMEYYSTDDMVADILTKPLSRDRFEKLQEKLKLENSCMQH